MDLKNLFVTIFLEVLIFPYLLILTGWIPLATLVTSLHVTLVTSFNYVKNFLIHLLRDTFLSDPGYCVFGSSISFVISDAPGLAEFDN